MKIKETIKSFNVSNFETEVEKLEWKITPFGRRRIVLKSDPKGKSISFGQLITLLNNPCQKYYKVATGLTKLPKIIPNKEELIKNVMEKRNQAAILEISKFRKMLKQFDDKGYELISKKSRFIKFLHRTFQNLGKLFYRHKTLDHFTKKHSISTTYSRAQESLLRSEVKKLKIYSEAVKSFKSIGFSDKKAEDLAFQFIKKGKNYRKIFKYMDNHSTVTKNEQKLAQAIKKRALKNKYFFLSRKELHNIESTSWKRLKESFTIQNELTFGFFDIKTYLISKKENQAFPILLISGEIFSFAEENDGFWICKDKKQLENLRQSKPHLTFFTKDSIRDQLIKEALTKKTSSLHHKVSDINKTIF